MSHKITLYGLGPTRSARCQWTLLELGVDFEFIEKRELIGSDELRKIHPQAKLPAIVISFYPEEKRVAGVVKPNNEEFRAGATVINSLLKNQHFMLGNTFTVTDIVIAWTLNWGRRMQLIDGFDNISGYLSRLFARTHCTLNQE